MKTKIILTSLLFASFASAWAYDLPQIKEKGRIKVAMYNDYPPFSDKGAGIDVDIANALAKKLGVALDIMGFEADESVDDDLRNVVWKGHYLGYGVADLMLHVPVDPVLSDRNEQSKIFSPYYRESIQVARNLERLPKLDVLEALSNEKIGVEIETAADSFLLSTMGGKLRNNIVHFKTSKEAMAALTGGEVSAVMGTRSDLEAGLVGKAKGFAIDNVLAPGLPVHGWNIGVAVKAGNDALFKAVDAALTEMTRDGTLKAIFAKHQISYRVPAP